jgi:putative transcriptional regulator
MKTPPTASLRNHFLLAMPRLGDSYFAKSVILLCEHNHQGAMGIIINRPMNINVREILAHLEIHTRRRSLQNQWVLAGGPMQPEQGFILHTQNTGTWQATQPLNTQISITTSRDLMVAIAEKKAPEPLLIALGHAGWAPGQLEEEIAQNDWLPIPFDAALLFETPYKDRWDLAMKTLGAKPSSYWALEAGHA